MTTTVICFSSAAAAVRHLMLASLAMVFFSAASVVYGEPPSAQKNTPKMYIGEYASLPEHAFWQQVVGKRIGRWYTKAPNGFPRAVSLAQAAIAKHDKANAFKDMVATVSGSYANATDEFEVIRRGYFPAWNKNVLLEQPDFWSVPAGRNPSVLGVTHFRQGFQGFILLARELPRDQLSAVYDHELTHYYILSGNPNSVRNASLRCLLTDGEVLDAVVLAAFGEITDRNMAAAKYWLQPAEVDVCLAEIKRRYVFVHKKHLDHFEHSPQRVWEWWRTKGATLSRTSDEPATIIGNTERFILLDSLPSFVRAWLFKRLLEIV
jgi:hypothetical protein